MNIDSANLIAMLPNKKSLDGDVSVFPENGATLDDFSNALKGQKMLLSEMSVQVELLGQAQVISVPQSIESSQDSGDLQKSMDAQDELVALLEKYLPISGTGSKKSENPGIDLTLLTLTEGLKAQDSGDLQKSIDTQDGLVALLEKHLPVSGTGPKKSENPAIDATLLNLTEGLKAIAPDINPDDILSTQDMSPAMALNVLAPVTPMPEDVKLNVSVDNVVTEGSLQKVTILRQANQSEQGTSLQLPENLDPTKQTLTLEKQSSLLGLEKTVPEVNTELPQVYNRPIDNRTDSLAIPKPLTHPSWSRDLGEQIIWMNNKGLATAEIKLNPEHLGPISVRIDVNQEHQATIMFTAQHAETRDTIEASISKLREMLATQQLNLVNVNISQNSNPDHGRPQPQSFHKTSENHGQNGENIDDPREKSEQGQVVVNKGLLNIYA